MTTQQATQTPTQTPPQAPTTTTAGTTSQTTPGTAISVRGLRRSFGDTLVLDGLDFEVRTGTVYALLGPNGAGKTTVVKILSTLIAADAGTVKVAGHDLLDEPDLIRAAIGVTGQFSAVDNLLTGRENLRLMAALNHLPRREHAATVDRLLEQFDLVEEANKPASTYSGGMRRRLDLAMTLVGRPRLIFLDEPTTGLDPRSRRNLWQSIRDLVATGVTVFLTTQYLDEADELADHVALLDHGRFVAEGTPTELKRSIPGGHVSLGFSDEVAIETAMRALPEATPGRDLLTLDVPTDGRPATLRTLLDRLDRADLVVTSLNVHTPDLDDVFLALTGRATEPTTTEATSEEER